MAHAETLIELTADLVAAHVLNNKVAIGDVAALVANVHAALSTLGAPAPAAAPEKKAPAVTVRASVKPETLTCLECGSKHKMLKRHLQTAHQLTPAEYRGRFDLPASYPMVAPNYAQQRSELAKRIGLGSSGRGSKESPALENDGAPPAASSPPVSGQPKPRTTRRKASSQDMGAGDRSKRGASAPAAAEAPVTPPDTTKSRRPRTRKA